MNNFNTTQEKLISKERNYVMPLLKGNCYYHDSILILTYQIGLVRVSYFNSLYSLYCTTKLTEVWQTTSLKNTVTIVFEGQIGSKVLSEFN